MSEMLLKYCAGLILMLGIGMTTLVSAETATTTDTEEVIVAREILQPKTGQNTSAQKSEAETEIAPAPQTQIANDMVEGQLQRDLPSLNEPVIDQANLLSPAEKQQLSQRILKLYNEGKGQIGVVIVPTTGQEDIFDYSMRVAEAWQLGSAKRD